MAGQAQPLVRIFEGRKFFWDGEAAGDMAHTEAREHLYREQGFEVRRHAEGEDVHLYTRRPAKTEGSG